MRNSLHRSRWWTCVLAGLWFLTACVTVNIYFPAAAAEKAADQFIEDVWSEQQTPGQQEPPPATPTEGRLEPRGLNLKRLADFLVPPAQAQANIEINTPAINRIKQSMSARFNQLRPWYDNGAVGLTRDGQVTVRDLGAVPLPQRSAVSRLVAEENRDRNALYREVAVANGHPEWENDVRSTFARQWIANARSGWWYQSGGGWKQK